MVSARTKLVNPMGMHMRPAQLFVKAVTPYPCSVTLVFNGREINGKSIMNLMAACIKQGVEIEIRCDGDQEADCLKTAVELVDSGLGE